jgi:CO/xanthine dehydrogenase FAD-binding subunit
MAEIRLMRPASLDEALDALATLGDQATILAGGCDVMPAYNAGTLRPQTLVFLGDAGLDGTRVANDGTSIGATTTLLTLASRGGALGAAARGVGSRAIQAQATLGGHLFCRPPYGDLLPVLLVLGAHVSLRSAQATRELTVGDFVGAGRDALRPGELAVEVQVPSVTGGVRFERLSLTRGMGPALLSAAAQVDTDASGRCRSVRLALNGAGPRPFRATRAEAVLVGHALDETAIATAAALAAEEADPSDDALASAWYRRKMAAVIAARVLRGAVSGGSA